MQDNQLIAAIDIGTNSIHMVIAYVDSKGALVTVRREKESVRLGESMGDMKHISNEAIERGITALIKFAEIARAEKAEVRATATSAIREAENKADFIREAKNRAGIPVEVISGSEEARLIYTGVIHSLPLIDKKIFVIDIGGGSTETIVGLNGEPIYLHSEKLGAIRLTKRFFDDGLCTSEKVNQTREYIHGVWNPVMDVMGREGFDIAVGTSGTIQSIASIAIAGAGVKPPDILNGIAIHSNDFLSAIERIISVETVNERNTIPGMDMSRSDILPAGSLIIEYAMKQLGIKKILISSFALREGIVFDTISKINSGNASTNQLRQKSIWSLVEKFEVNKPHAEKVKELSEILFSAFYRELKLDNRDIELLNAAAMLHDCGYFISEDSHHKHSYYLITNSDLPGFSDEEQTVIANVARYHRKSLPNMKHTNYSELNEKLKYKVSALSSILRIAEGLDRRMLQLVEKLAVVDDGSRVRIIPVRKNSHVIDVEIWGASRRCDLLEKLIGRPILIIEE